MGEIAKSDRQITLFYSSKSSRAKQTLAYAQAEGLPIQEIDILNTKLSGTQIVGLASRLHPEVVGLKNQECPAYSSMYEHHKLATKDWIKMTHYNVQIMKQSIVLGGDTTYLSTNSHRYH